MATGMIRATIIYILLIFTIRMTGKRQIGELEVSELVSTFLISEIASAPIGNQEIPLTFAIVPMLLIVSLEIIVSYSVTRFEFAKLLFLGRPIYLIRRGKVDKAALADARMTVEELLTELRQSGVTTIEDVDYAILENNGKLSVIPRANASPPSAADLGINVSEKGIVHAVIVDGKIKKQTLCDLGKNRRWLDGILQKHDLSAKDVFILTADDCDNIYIVRKK